MARSLTAASSLVATALLAGGARAQQLDLNPPKPDVLLLIDNSGSMERMIDGSLPEDNAANACDVSQCQVGPIGTTCTWASTPPAGPNRWNVLLNSLVGSPTNGFHCIAMPRDQGPTSDFVNEYQINGAAPYDNGYYLKYHRAVGLDTTTVSNTSIPCVFAPGTLPGAAPGSGVGTQGFGAGGSADAFPANAIITRPYGQVTVDQSTKTMTCQFGLNPDGALLIYQDLMRFALMTFDQDPSAGTGVTANSPYSVLDPPFDGMWSYFLNWGGGGTPMPASGKPVGCATFSPFEVGARNPAAPPWEGRMVSFSPPSDSDGARQTQNQQIRQVLSATRPYGGTPIAGMLDDARTYLWNDPNGPGMNDPSVSCPNGRPLYVILLTDGAPNLDLRPSCDPSNTNGVPSTPCPYNQPETIVQDLLSGGSGHPKVTTFVIGFAVSSGADQGGTLVKCSQLDPTGVDCQNPTPALAPCCELQKIAVSGQPPTANPHAYFVDTPGDLQAALSSILAQISFNVTTRTVPSYSPVTSNVVTSGSTNSNQNTFNSFFTPGVPPTSTGTLVSTGTPWTGDIQRTRYLCNQTPRAQSVLASAGDDFSQNLAAGGTRHFFAFLPEAPIDSSATIRPHADTNTVLDGLGSYGSQGTQYSDTASGIVGVITPPALGLKAGAQSCQYTSGIGGGTGWLSDTQCAAMLLDFTFGQPFGGGPSNFQFVSRAGTFSPKGTTTPLALAFGGIYHATPTVVGPPGALLHDDSYDLFRTSSQATAPGFGTGTPAVRDTIVYAATIDGLLHAFWADESQLANNEEWAFLPPAVMPQLQSSYPGANQLLLDGAPIVKDVVLTRPQGGTGANPWRTMLVAGFGPSQRGYYAVDVTKPVYSKFSSGVPSDKANGDPSLPVFMWQLTKMPATNRQLFGQHGTTPAITQVAIGTPGNVNEVGVAILPGGWDTAAVKPAGTNQGCERDTRHRGLTDWAPSGDYAARSSVRCWGASGNYADPVVGRSVTIVRLDTGEVLATFMRKADAPATDTLLLGNRIIDTPLDSPMTGTPAVYPSLVGADATKFFIGDMDGTVWRFDISNPDPTKWTGKLFYDLYNSKVDTNNSGDDWANGQPIAVPLVTSVNRVSQVVVHAASGSTDSFDQTGPNFLASLTETVQTISGTTDFHAQVNWWMGSQNAGVTNGLMDPGERVSGPMVVFDSNLNFTTYSAGASGGTCPAGASHLWQLDFVTPDPGPTWTASLAATGQGGMLPNPAPPVTGSKHYLDLSADPNVGKNVVVPGVSIQQTTACATLATAGADLYVPGALHSTTTSYTPGSFSIVAQTGKSNGSGGVGTYQRALPTPTTATVIDSWAAVTE